MNFKLLHRVSAFIVFLISTVILLMTVAPTLSFWDCGEFITAAVTMAVPHPPGAPFFQLVGRAFSLIPFGDIGWRVNLQAVFSASISVLFVHLVIMRMLRLWHGDPTTVAKSLVMILSAATGALVMAFSDTFWFSAVESEVYAIGMFFITVVVWMGLEWYAKAGMFNTERTLLMIAYILGLSIGIHLLSILIVFFVFFLIYVRGREVREITPVSILLFVLAMAGGFAVIYPGVVKYIPKLLTTTEGTYFVILLAAGMVALIALKKFSPTVRLVMLSILLVVLGYTTFSIVPIRANQQPALNENAPTDMKTLYSYLNREQYGDYPLIKGPSFDNAIQNINPNQSKFFPRRWNPEAMEAYKKYSSDFDFFVSYQMAHLYIRYFLWNFSGRAGDMQDAPAVLFSTPEGDWSDGTGWPNKFYGIPLILGLIGMFYNFRKDWRTGAAMMAFFIIMGAALVVYFNMHEPQVRERDYFWVGSFAAFSIWVGIGVYGLWDLLKSKLGGNETVGVALAGVLFIAGPGVMLNTAFHTHDRHLNYVAFDYAYNLLQSCDQDAILFTGGDNDTFPVWYMQYVGGVRRDVRIVNLSLVNTEWYAKQLKNEMPYGAKKVELTFSDMEIQEMRPVQWETQTLSIPLDKAYFGGSTLMDVPEIKTVGIPDTFHWSITAPWQDGRGTKGLRNQDIYILDIVRKNINTRPIYFALSTAPSDRLNLDPYMMVEGLAARVTPFKFQNHSYRYYPAMNIPVTLRHLTTPRETPDSNRAYGFMFRELNNPDVNLDEPSRKMVYSFRLLYMELAKAIFQEQNDKKTADDVLDRMEKTMPQALHEMTNDVKIQLALSYYVLRDAEKTKTLANELEAVLMPDADKFIRGESDNRQSLSILLDLYEVSQQYSKGVDIMKKYAQLHPEDPSVNVQIQSWEARARMPKDTASK